MLPANAWHYGGHEAALGGFVMPEATFPLPQPAAGRMANAWAVHQVETCVGDEVARRCLMYLPWVAVL